MFLVNVHIAVLKRIYILIDQIATINENFKNAVSGLLSWVLTSSHFMQEVYKFIANIMAMIHNTKKMGDAKHY